MPVGRVLDDPAQRARVARWRRGCAGRFVDFDPKHHPCERRALTLPR